jgi:hypothetical protein
MVRILLGLAGAGLGLIAWALFGLGLADLGFLPEFDPLDRNDGPAVSSTATRIVELSFPLFAVAGAFIMPRLFLWMLRSPEEIDAGR